MKIAIFPGSFDPFTKGHLEILKKATNLFDKIIICILENSSKTQNFSSENKLEIIKLSTKELKNIEIKTNDGLLVDFAKANNANFIVKGLRNQTDFEYENSMYQINKKLDENIETIYIICNDEYRNISSTAVRELIKFDADFSFLIEPCAYKFIKNLKES